ncbi:hypothetical protein QJS10_CPB04g01807 [Acorus calamus]|uniref:Disease resistance protein n=1 Tax=Acorus calamus TaxID=4465 RepID=A0AAV9F2C7_ACOCL|nr:hypothetical protein QJS10_CPB04g01807 [Acorus calamus]
MVRWSSLERLEVLNCPMLKALPLQGDKQSNLMELRGQREWWEKHEWRDRGRNYFNKTSQCSDAYHPSFLFRAYMFDAGDGGFKFNDSAEFKCHLRR